MVMAPAKPKKPTTSRKIAAESQYHARIQRLLALLEPSHSDHILITHPLDVGYLSGFLGGESYLFLGPARPLIISDSRYEEELEPQKPLADLHIRTKPINAAAAGAQSRCSPAAPTR